MSNPGPLGGRVPALFTEAGELVGDHLKGIATFATIGAFLTEILSGFFGIRLTPYGTAFENLITSDWFISLFVFTIFMSQIMMFQRISWIVSRLESEGLPEEDKEAAVQEEQPAKMTDGGRSNQPRDSKGRFKAKDSGSSNLLLIAMAGMTGYLIASQSSSFDPITGALLGIGVITFLQARSD